MKSSESKTTRLIVVLASLLGLFGVGTQAWAIGTTNVLQWPFTSTSGNVTVPVADTSGFSPSHPGANLIDNNGSLSYSADIPANAQYCTGVGSVDFSGVTTAISTAASEGVGSGQGIIIGSEVVAAGGLTLEVWVKNPSGNGGLALNVGGYMGLGVKSDGQVCVISASGADALFHTTIPSGQWAHLAMVAAGPTSSSVPTFSTVSFYVNGQLVHTTNHQFYSSYLGRAVSVGNHQYANFSDYNGLIYEPRIKLGVVPRSQFTITSTPPVVVLTSPANSQVFSAPATVPLSVSATNNGFSITNVSYYEGATLIASSGVSPFSTNWSGAAAGGYSLTAVATYTDGLISGTVTSAPVSITVNTVASTPTFNPPAGGYVGAQSVAISSATIGATIYYTTNGATPTTGSAVYSSPIVLPVNATTTIKALATASGYSDSAVATATYVTAPVATWTSLAGGSWANSANWDSGVIGNGSGSTNKFNTLTMTANQVLTLDNSPTVGTMLFADLGNTYTWTINPGTGGTLTLAAPTPPVVEVSNNTATIAVNVAGTGGLLKTGAGQLTISGASTGLSGGATVSAGTLQLNTAFAGNGVITLNDANTAANNTTLRVNSTSVGNPITVANQGAGNSAIAYTFAAANTAYGGAAITLDRATTFSFPNLSGYLQFNSPVTGSGDWIITNTAAGAGGRLILNTSISYSGNIYIQNGALLDPRNKLTGNPNVTVESGGYMWVIFGTTTINALNGSGPVGTAGVTLPGTLVVGNANGSGNYSGAMNGTGGALFSLTKEGTGTQILSGASTYAGATTINNGTLRVDGSLAAGSAVAVNGGTLGGSGTVGGAVTVNSGGTLAPGASIGTLGIGSLTLNSGATVALEIGDGPSADKAAASGAVTYGGTLKLIWTGATPAAGTVDLFDGSSFAGAFSSVQYSNWPSAYRVITNNLTTDGTIAIAANSAPVASDITIGAARGATVTLQVVGGKYGPIDADGDSIAITMVGSPTSGTAGYTSTSVTYTASGSLGTNTFSYTVADAFGATDTKTVTVIVSDPQGFNQLAPPQILGGGTVALSYLGIPGYNYALDWTTNLTPPINWTAVVTNTAGTNGLLNFTNTSAEPVNFFKTRYVP